MQLDASSFTLTITSTTSLTTSTSLANGSAPTRHQAGMSTTMPNALRGMYLLITSLRGKWSRSIGTYDQQGMKYIMSVDCFFSGH
jgi:hypothetical protein